MEELTTIMCHVENFLVQGIQKCQDSRINVLMSFTSGNFDLIAQTFTTKLNDKSTFTVNRLLSQTSVFFFK